MLGQNIFMLKILLVMDWLWGFQVWAGRWGFEGGGYGGMSKYDKLLYKIMLQSFVFTSKIKQSFLYLYYLYNHKIWQELYSVTSGVGIPTFSRYTEYKPN